jgi:hypothetical protein
MHEPKAKATRPIWFGPAERLQHAAPALVSTTR